MHPQKYSERKRSVSSKLLDNNARFVLDESIYNLYCNYKGGEKDIGSIRK